MNYISPYQGFDSINEQITEFMSNYNGLQAALQKRIGTHSLVNVNHTWFKAMTNAFNDTSPAQNTYNLAAEYGPASYDRTNIFNANFVYDLPFYQTQSGLVGHVLGGWEVSGLVNSYSGLPYTVTGVLNDPAGQGVLDGNSAVSGRPDLVGYPNIASSTSGRFTTTMASSFGTTPRPMPRYVPRLAESQPVLQERGTRQFASRHRAWAGTVTRRPFAHEEHQIQRPDQHAISH
ncbi:hypothetical protein [Alloacidobacterium sp.]|uniref:hypothetical protein n=1 Tax=Alloacidobacterium sp. TaxID=2951999 RepID=UPI002D5DBE85|nr:hypothetical protein [Alloacidobacterium sp.]HYK36495.1 hypothetical protein [Alloacidobacterium sp.]